MLGLRVESCVVEEVMLINTIHQEGQLENLFWAGIQGSRLKGLGRRIRT